MRLEQSGELMLPHEPKGWLRKGAILTGGDRSTAGAEHPYLGPGSALEGATRNDNVRSIYEQTCLFGDVP